MEAQRPFMQMKDERDLNERTTGGQGRRTPSALCLGSSTGPWSPLQPAPSTQTKDLPPTDQYAEQGNDLWLPLSFAFQFYPMLLFAEMYCSIFTLAAFRPLKRSVCLCKKDDDVSSIGKQTQSTYICYCRKQTAEQATRK
ncbi:hypothetical protein Zm00014a_025244 [Zea mays]|uniref:Uncharacterized protein n=1 Tax=Zea mays TaxID=4577 RepID=A0A3L6DU97_MAIZE|nr:hypothetical protein Zm00014a_025244 [Zea mays]